MSAVTERGFRPWLWALLAGWAVFTLWCCWGFPPSVDLPAHAAQLETVKNLLLGDPAVSSVYQLQFPLGYGLPIWLFLPLAFLTNGALAARAALWVALQLLVLSQLALLRTFRRPDWYLLLGLPLAFNLSYWYGLLPGLFAQPFVLFALAAYARWLKEPSRRRWPLLLNLSALACMLSHLVAFVALCVALGAFALSQPSRRRTLGMMAGGLVAPLLLSFPKVLSMAQRAVVPGDWPATSYQLSSHFAWFFQNYRPEGVLAAWAPLAVTVALAALYLRRRKLEPLAPAAMFFASVALYLATPKTLSGIYLIAMRLPVVAGLLSLALVGSAGFPRLLRVLLVGLSLASLGETALFHQRFARAMDGLGELIREPPPERHGYLSLAGRQLMGSKHVYLDHLGQWWTATHGRVGHNFFAGAEHHPVRFREGAELPAELRGATREELKKFEALLVYGEAPLPAELAGWQESQRAGAWRKLVRPRSP